MDGQQGIPPYRLRPGDQVEIAGLDGVFTVAAADDRSLVTLALPNGGTLKVGWRRLRWPEMSEDGA